MIASEDEFILYDDMQFIRRDWRNRNQIKTPQGLFLDLEMLSGFAAVSLAPLSWMAAMTKFDLSHTYPFMSLSLVVVLLLSGWLLSEPMTMQKALGVELIVLGTVVAARG
jgi:uncharacterized membrane protein